MTNRADTDEMPHYAPFLIVCIMHLPRPHNCIHWILDAPGYGKSPLVYKWLNIDIKTSE